MSIIYIRCLITCVAGVATDLELDHLYHVLKWPPGT